MIDFIYSGDYIVPPPQPAAKPDSPPEEPLTSETLSGSIFDSMTASVITTGPVDNVEPDTAQELLVHTAVYIFAEEKDIPKLKALATEKYEKALPNGWNSAAFCDSLRRIYEETPETDHLLWHWQLAGLVRKPRSSWTEENLLSCGERRQTSGWQFFAAISLHRRLQPVQQQSPPLQVRACSPFPGRPYLLTVVVSVQAATIMTMSLLVIEEIDAGGAKAAEELLIE